MKVDYYAALEVSPGATAEAIKISYRRLAKQHHPDLNNDNSGEKMRLLNEAYAVLSEPARRQTYDQAQGNRVYRVGAVPRKGKAVDDSVLVARWLQQVYRPVQRYMRQVLAPFTRRIEILADDPYDDQYIEEFQHYLNQSQAAVDKAWECYRSQPNPAVCARIAEYLYHALNQVQDGLDELAYFSQNYDYHHIHTGQELFAIASEMQEKAAFAVSRLQEVPR